MIQNLELHFDLGKSLLMNGPRQGSVPLIVVTFGKPLRVRLNTWRGKNREVPDGAAIRFMVKDGLLDADALAIIDAWQADEFGFVGELDFNTVTFHAAIGTAKKLSAVCELILETEDGFYRSQVVNFVVLRPVISGYEGSPLALPNAEQWARDRMVRYDEQQALSAPQRVVALGNLGIQVNADGEVTIVTAFGTFRGYFDKIS